MAGNQVDIIIKAVEKGVSETFSKLDAGLKRLDVSLVAGKSAASKYGTVMSALKGPVDALNSSLAALTAGIGSGLFAKALFEAGVQSQQLNLAFKAITGDAPAAAKELGFVRDEAKRLGLEFLPLAASYKGIAAASKGTALEGDSTRKIFTGISEAAAALGLSGDQAAGALLAISQMISKGKVQAEELRGQLGERLPGAFNLMAESMGVTTAQLDVMLKKGEVGTDVLIGFADLLDKRYGPAASENAKGALAALNSLKTAWFDLKVAIANAGFLDQAAGYLKKISDAISDPAVKKAVIEWATSFFSLADSIIKTAWEYKGFLLAAAGTMVVTNLFATLTTAVWGLNAALTALTGEGIVLWFKGMIQFAGMAASALALIPGAIATIAAALSGLGGWEIGTLLNKFDVVKQAGISLASGLTLAWLNTKLAWASLTGGDTSAIEQELAQARQIYGDMFAEIQNGARQTSTVQSTEQKKATDAVKGAATDQKQTATQLTDFARQNEEKRKQYQGAALDEMKKKYQDYAAEVRRLQDEISGREQSLTDQLRTMARSGMSDVSAWNDLKKDADEYAAAAKTAAAAGDFTTAVAAADKAKEKYAELNTEVKDGDQIMVTKAKALKTAMDGVKEAGEIGIAALTALQEGAVKSMDSLVAKSGFQDLTAGMDEAKKQWLDNWEKMRAGSMDQIATVEQRIVELTKDRYVTVYVNEVVQKHLGGMVQRLASGGFPRLAGKLPGSDGPDGIRALLAPGEFIMRSAAVRKYGAALFHALNSMRLDVGSLISGSLSGAIGRITVPSMEPVRMFDGGLAGAGMSGTSNTYNLSLTIPGQPDAPQQANARALAKMVLGEFEKMHRGRS
jgi:tape measure domain-containing protein